MKIGFVGLGKLGLPCALGFEIEGGYEVHGYDANPAIATYLAEKTVPYREALIEEHLEGSNLTLHVSAEKLVEICDVIFVAVQTPHEELYEGATPVPNSRKDFDYSYLQEAINSIANGLKSSANNPLIVVISTVLPGTMRDKIMPILAEARSDYRFCYNPYFIAMGTTLPDFLNPEFILIGSESKDDANYLASIYEPIHSAGVQIMEIESAELTKVAYNTFIGFKIVFANTLAEICSARGGNVDEITQALASASMRLMSAKYLKAGMGDGGGCHPRDQIAMSWLAEDANLSTDLFGYLARARDSQTERQAQLIAKVSAENNLPVCILGWSYKPETNLTVGSPARLLGSILNQIECKYTVYDPYVFPDNPLPAEPHLFFVATNHGDFNQLRFTENSIVIDPWGMDSTWGSAQVIMPGRK
jgi:UDPglucose 6-dehydrogenase